MSDNKEIGYVYILTNPSFREDWVKIGKSSRPVDVRSKELDNTAVPLPFEIFATIKTVKYNEVEKHVHKTIDRLTDLRIRQNREFFNVAVITRYKDNKPINESMKENGEVFNEQTKIAKRGRFKFSMVNIKVGEYITFTPTNLQVKVASDDTVEYDGRIYKLSPFVGTFMPKERQTQSGAYQGAKYFTYNGEILDDLRTKMEQNKEDK